MKKFSIACLLTLFGLTAWSQGSPDIGMEQIPGEAVYVHQNTAMLFAGETLYYKVYCRNTSSGVLSGLSKLAYVALVDKAGETVFHHKVRLENGLGQGDFFVPAEVPTGSYKLLGYTQWMKNGTGSPVYASDVMLINPYLSTPEEYQEPVMPDSLSGDSLLAVERPVIRPPAASESVLKGTLDRDTYGTRQQVRLRLETLREDIPGGHYSISVRRVPEFSQPETLTAEKYAALRTGPVAGRPAPANLVLPELRGELLRGRVRGTGENNRIANLPVALSLPGDEFVFDIARTNAQGEFYLNLDRDYEAEQGIFQVLGTAAGTYSIAIEATLPAIPAGLAFYEFTLTPGMAKEIRDRSIRNQIENAYVETRSDTLERQEPSVPFYRNFQSRYELDDFTRFNTIAETLVEVVDQVWLSTNAAGEPMFQVRPFDGYLDGIGMAPMVFMDGLFIQNHEDIVGFPARQIKNIFISRDRYQIGANVYQGILAFETFASDFSENYYRDFLFAHPLFKPQPEKSYFVQRYNADMEQQRIPDFRQQLYWEPDVRLASQREELYWFTSDLKGTYEVKLEGFSSTGKAISWQDRFYVE